MIVSAGKPVYFEKTEHSQEYLVSALNKIDLDAVTKHSASSDVTFLVL